MKFYRIFSDKTDQKVEITHERFSIISGILNIFWAFYRGHWQIAIIYFLIILIIVSSFSNEMTQYFSHFTTILFAIFPCEIEELSYKIKGYKFKEVIAANNEIEAEYKYLSSKHFEDNNLEDNKLEKKLSQIKNIWE